jgi:hypothetical protein
VGDGTIGLEHMTPENLTEGFDGSCAADPMVDHVSSPPSGSIRSRSIGLKILLRQLADAATACWLGAAAASPASGGAAASAAKAC